MSAMHIPPKNTDSKKDAATVIKITDEKRFKPLGISQEKEGNYF